MEYKKKQDYESPQVIVVELKMESALLQASASKPDYINGGQEIWPA